MAFTGKSLDTRTLISTCVVAGLLVIPGMTRAQEGSWGATSLANAPNARRLHTAVWTGSRMIVWGGEAYPSTVLNTGALYDPTSDTWTPTSTVNAASPRYCHTAVWTGSKMIVWGGYTSVLNTGLNTGALYDPATDTWTPTSTVNAPSARAQQTAIWTGSKMIVWGGYSGSSNLSTGAVYDPTTNSWTATSTINAPRPRYYHTAVWTGSRMIVWGGLADAIWANTGAAYDPATDTWTPTSTTNAPSGRILHSAVWTGSKMIVWGGGPGGAWVNTGARYDPATDTWTPTSTVNAPSGRRGHTAVWTGSRMIVWAGYDGSSRVNTGALYDPATDTWTPISTVNAPVAREQHTAVWSGSGMIAWGGEADSGELDTGGVYYGGGQAFYTVAPCRVLDSRDPTGPFNGIPLYAGAERHLVVAGPLCGIPNTADAVSINITVTEATAAGHVRLYPGGTPTPQVSTINFRAGQTRANNAIAVLGTGSDIALYSGQPYGSSVHVVIDVNGYFE